MPIHIRTLTLAAHYWFQLAVGGAIPESYWRHGRRWAVWGTIATVIPLANLYFMVFKP